MLLRDYINLIEAVQKGCPPATQSIDLNLRNRQKAIEEYGYGPLNPNEPNEEFWQRLGVNGTLMTLNRSNPVVVVTALRLISAKTYWIALPRALAVNQGLMLTTPLTQAHWVIANF